MTNLHSFFNPKSIAVVGASHKKEKLGYQILKNIVEFNNSLKVYPVNVKGGVVLGKRVYKSLLDIPSRVDLVVVVVPAKFVPDIVRDAIVKGVGGLIVISAGFKESGGQGSRLEDSIKIILNKAREKGINTRLLGVNCLGIVSYENNINASFLARVPRSGTLAFVSQSGAFGAALLDWAIQKNLGIRHFVSIGNKTDLTELDFFEYFLKDENTKIIAAYLESIGHGTKEDGKRFVTLLRKITPKKPVVLILPGESAYAKKAIGSHTGSLVDDAKVIKETAIRNGAIVVQNLEELFNVLLLLDAYSYKVLQKLNKLMIVTNAGGPGVLATDLMSKTGFKLASLSSDTVDFLKNNLPIGANVHGPVDVLGDADSYRYRLALEILLKNKEADGIVTILTPQSNTQVKETAEVIIDLNKKSISRTKEQLFSRAYNKMSQLNNYTVKGADTGYVNERGLSNFKEHTTPIFPVFIGGESLKPAFNLFDKYKVPYFRFPSVLFTSIQRIVSPNKESKKEYRYKGNKYAENLDKLRREQEFIHQFKHTIFRFLQLYEKYIYKGHSAFKRLDPFLTEVILKILKIPLPRSFYLSLTTNKFIQFVSQVFNNVTYDFSSIYNIYSKNSKKDFIYRYVKKASSIVPFPWVLKVTGTSVLHATDKGFILLNIKNKHQAVNKIYDLVNKLKKDVNFKKAGLEISPFLYIQIQEQVPVDVEVFAGLKSSQIFDGVLAFGWGGIYTEILKDIKQSSLPATKELIAELFKETRVYSLIKGARGTKGFDFDKLIEVIYRISLLTQLISDLKEADFNPIIVNRRGIYVADYKILI